MNCFDQDDPDLIEMVGQMVVMVKINNSSFLFQIKQKITPPSGWNEEYNLTHHKSLDELFLEKEDDEEDLSLEMEEYYLKDVKNGFFIEAGASEGIILI